jgi:hypothetical protein
MILPITLGCQSKVFLFSCLCLDFPFHINLCWLSPADAKRAAEVSLSLHSVCGGTDAAPATTALSDSPSEEDIATPNCSIAEPGGRLALAAKGREFK